MLVITVLNVLYLVLLVRFLMEGAFNSHHAYLFGGKVPNKTNPKLELRPKKGLLEENQSFGSMPTHPLGTSTVFHAGVIGEGKRNIGNGTNVRLSKDAVEFNQFAFLSILFKLCHTHTGKFKPEIREKSKEACKQLALLVVEMISPDVMYNGLPWPEEEFIKVIYYSYAY